ncbi:MAG: hypothetical protein L3K26_13370 [Candidatus Hydrogenedentes bacterium]|nr:hypothetical protein [Candidatus Hydrogenedentota bacterium]
MRFDSDTRVGGEGASNQWEQGENLEWGACKIRSSVGFCHECDMLLCEVCSHTCERCGTTVCKSHIQRSKSGRRICVSCVVHHYDKRAKKSLERREMRAEAVAAGGRGRHRSEHRQSAEESTASPKESLSFDALNQEGDFRTSTAPMDEAVAFSPVVDDDALNQRVLTGSANARTPAWASGLIMSIVAWALFFGALSGTRLGLQQVIFNVLSLIVGLGAMVWCGPASFGKGDKEIRVRSRIAFAIGLGVVLLSGLVFYVRLTA